MRVSFGKHAIEIKSWETKGELIQFLSKCDAGNLLLGEEAEREEQFFSAAIALNFSGLHRFGIGICSEGHGLQPHVLLLQKSDILLFGCDREVSAVSIKNRDVAFKIKLDSLFSSFLHLGEHSVILIFHEIGVLAMTEDGQNLWKCDRDIIIDAYLESDNLHLEFMDSPPICLNIVSRELQLL